MKQTEQRTRKMMKNFIKHREDGKGVYQIADIYNLSPCTVYAHLEEIAKEIGCERDDSSGRGRAAGFLREAAEGRRVILFFV